MANGDLVQLLNEVVYARLRPEQVYRHESHRFQASGDKLRGGCPWHESRSSSSFNINIHSLMWYCGGCCKGGSPLQYLWQLRGGEGSPTGDDFFAIARELFDLADVPFPEQQLTAEQQERAAVWEKYRDLLLAVTAAARDVLWSNRGESARVYLHDRGFTDDNIQDLGYGLCAPVAVLETELQKRGADINLAASTGVLNDDVAGYVSIPWDDQYGRPLTLYYAWPGERAGQRPHKRSLRNLKINDQVVVHAKKSPLYFDRARRAKQNHVVLVEGVFDAALAQVGGDNRVVACVAACVSTQQALTLQRCHVKAVTICLDPDSAGDAGIGSCVRSLSQVGIRTYVTPRLPESCDPDDFILAHGIRAWKQHVGNAGGGWKYLAHKELVNIESLSEPERNAAIDRAGQLLNEMPSDSILRHEVVQLIAVRSNLPLESLRVKYDRVVETKSAEPNGADDDIPELPRPKPLDCAALHGLAGDVVRLLAPHTEADPVAILLQFLTAFGNAAGRSAHFQIEADRHYLKLFTCLVGATAKGRKGTSLGYIRRLFSSAATEWAEHHVCNGLVSGEGLIWEVRDEIKQRKPRKEKGGDICYHEVITDEGVLDKRLLVIESEFSSVLKVIRREGNTLSQVVRDAWDECRTLRTLAKTTPARATNSHVSLVGHITSLELRRQLTQVEIGNGFGNRFLWLFVERSKVLPHGGNLREASINELAQRLSEALEAARFIERMRWSEEASRLWEEVYTLLSADRPGLTGALTARAEAQTLRLAAIYAAIDGSPVIKSPHLQAGLAVWQYCEDSVRCIFGDRVGDPLAERILELLRPVNI